VRTASTLSSTCPCMSQQLTSMFLWVVLWPMRFGQIACVWLLCPNQADCMNGVWILSNPEAASRPAHGSSPHGSSPHGSSPHGSSPRPAHGSSPRQGFVTSSMARRKHEAT
jgi:hypothetical protein